MRQSPSHPWRVVPWRSMQAPAAVAAWDVLALRAVEPNPFFESWFLLPALEGLDPQGKVELLVLESGGEWLGLMPVVRQARYYGRPIPHLSGWMHPNGLIGAPLVVAGMEQAFWQALLEWADAQGGLGLFLHLADLPLEGALADGLRQALAEDGRMAALVGQRNQVMLRSNLAPEAYYEATVSGKKRKEYRRQANRLSDLGEVQICRRNDAENVDVWVQDFLDLEAAGWKGKAGSALASAAHTTLLWREALHGAAQRGRLERLSLTLNNRPIAMLASFITPPAAFMFKTCFDESLAAFSPGVLLQRENLAMLNHPHVQWVDSCADESHPMIPHLWRERRRIGAVSIAIGGGLRRAVFAPLAMRERVGQV
jgi:CelD/BcsL family acetyltransferase involved in cellulose biosynthesis